MNAEEVASFVAEQGENVGVPIMAPEPYNMDKDYIDKYLNNNIANQKTQFICGHTYGVKPYKYKTYKEVWMTEHFTNTGDPDNWKGALNVARKFTKV